MMATMVHEKRGDPVRVRSRESTTPLYACDLALRDACEEMSCAWTMGTARPPHPSKYCCQSGQSGKAPRVMNA